MLMNIHEKLRCYRIACFNTYNNASNHAQCRFKPLAKYLNYIFINFFAASMFCAIERSRPHSILPVKRGTLQSFGNSWRSVLFRKMEESFY